jgi:hypothetical protein
MKRNCVHHALQKLFELQTHLLCIKVDTWRVFPCFIYKNAHSNSKDEIMVETLVSGADLYGEILVPAEDHASQCESEVVKELRLVTNEKRVFWRVVCCAERCNAMPQL